MNPNELRRQAKVRMDQAQELFRSIESAAREATAEEEQRHDSLVAQAESLIAKAREIEARNGRIDALQAALRDNPGRVGEPLLPHNDPANTRDGLHGYSVLKALRQMMDAKSGVGSGLDGVERETHDELAKFRSRKAQGVLIPWDLAVPRSAVSRGVQMRATGTVDTTAGTGAIPTILGPMIDILRARMVTAGLGATFLPDMTGKFALPRQNQAGTAYWVAEGGAPTTSNQTIDQVAFDPKTVGAYTDYTRRLLEQSSVAAEGFVRGDLTAVVARGLESASLNGSGSSNQPKGILQYGGNINTVAIGTNGGPLTWASVVDMESQVAIDNADVGTLAYCVNAKTRGYLKSAPKIGTTFPQFIWETSAGATPLNGYGAATTNLLPANLTKGSGTALSAAIFGNWADLIIALWSGMDVMVDPFTLSTSGGVRIVVLQDADINIRHPESFAICTDITNVAA